MICDKIAYDTYKAAQSAMSGLNQKYKQRMKCYKCAECGTFHLATIRNNKGFKKKTDLKYPIQIPAIEKKKTIAIPKTRHPKVEKQSKKINKSITTYKPFQQLLENQPKP